MAKPVSIQFSFATQSGPIPLSELDANFNALAAAINDTLTYSTFLTDTSGAANTVTVQTTSGVTFSYVVGTQIQVQVANTTTSGAAGAVTMNVNGLGAKTIVYSDGTTLAQGALRAAGIYNFSYDGTSWRMLNGYGVNTPASFGPNVNATGVAGQDVNFTLGIPTLGGVGIGYNNSSITNVFGAASGSNYVGTSQVQSLVITTSGVTRMSFGPTGLCTVAAPTAAGTTLDITAPTGGNSLYLHGTGAGNTTFGIFNSVTTGSATATFTATNKPGSASAVVGWLPVNADGNLRYMPLFA